MAMGLCIRRDGTVVVAFGARKIAIPQSHYRANGYRPPIDLLPAEAVLPAPDGTKRRKLGQITKYSSPTRRWFRVRLLHSAVDATP